jgi:AhpD family alkylhydroperoxidase
MSNPFPLHTIDTAPDAVRGDLETMQTRMGFLPTMAGKLAEAPPLLMAYQAAAPFFEQTSLTPAERTVVLMAASHRQNCDFCMTAHSWGAQRQGLDAETLKALRVGAALPDGKFEALRLFTLAMLEKRGAVSEQETQAFLAAGYSPRQALEVILGLALKTMTNYTNALARTPPNPEFGDAVWLRRG